MAEEEKNDTIQLNKKQVAFLAAYSECGNITRAAELSEIDRTSHHRWMKENQEYRAAFANAELHAIDRLEQEARRRAVEGVSEPVFHKGKVVGEVQKYSDTLLIFLMKGANPEKYKDRVDSTNHNTNLNTDLTQLSPEERRARIDELNRRRGNGASDTS